MGQSARRLTPFALPRSATEQIFGVELTLAALVMREVAAALEDELEAA